jgi:hypothetical protein
LTMAAFVLGFVLGFISAAVMLAYWVWRVL